MKGFSFLLLFICGFIPLFAQTNPSEALLTGKVAKQGQRYAKTITVNDLKKHLYVLAADSLEGRETATRGQHKAAAYIRNHFQSIGLQPIIGTTGEKSYYHSFNLEKVTQEETYIVFNGQTYLNLRDVIFFENGLEDLKREVG